MPHIGQDHAVHAPAVGQFAVGPLLGTGGGGNAQDQGVVVLGKSGFDAGNESGEEGVRAEELGIAGHHQPQRVGLCRGQALGAQARFPAQVFRDLEDPAPGGIADAGLAVERIRDSTFADAGRLGDIADGYCHDVGPLRSGFRDSRH